MIFHDASVWTTSRIHLIKSYFSKKLHPFLNTLDATARNTAQVRNALLSLELRAAKSVCVSRAADIRRSSAVSPNDCLTRNQAMSLFYPTFCQQFVRIWKLYADSLRWTLILKYQICARLLLHKNLSNCLNFSWRIFIFYINDSQTPWHSRVA